MTTQQYALPNDWDLARRRLQLLEACHDAATFRRAEALGVGTGWRCLEAGAGHGSVARWLAERVGDSGSVLAVDLDVSLLAEVDLPGLEVRAMDLATQELPAGAFDFVHTRLVLMHIPEREAVLRRLVGALRPGGVLLLEEDDIHPVLATARGAYREAWDAFLGVMGAGGTDPEWARDLPERLGELGLVDVDAEVDGQLFRGGSDAARFWSVTWQQGRDRAISQGVPDAVVDAGIAVLGDPARWFHGPAKIVTWGRRPPDAPYVMGRTEAEHERLRLQAAQLEPATVELLDRVGIDAGASALDVGTGTGAVMRLLAERVGPGGRVVGVDLDGPLGRRAETELHAAGHLQTRFAEGDFLTMPLPDEGPFDVTYARLLLLHAADPPAVLRRMWEWTASGGAVVVQDYDQRSVAADPPLPLIDEFRRVVFAVFEAAGRALDPGLRLRRWFAEAGMGEIDGSAANGVVAPLTTARPIIEGVYRSMLPLALEWGVTGEAESAAWLDEFAAASPDHTVLFPLLLGAWKRKP